MFDRDGREITFVGVQLGFASSQTPGKPRWSEIRIYRTAAGTYVVSQIACTSIPGEDPWQYVHVSDTAAGVVEQLHRYDDNSVRYITKTARAALLDAAKQDDALRLAFAVEEVA